MILILNQNMINLLHCIIVNIRNRPVWDFGCRTGFCRTGTGVRRVLKYMVAGTCRKIQIYHYFWTFVIISYNINHYWPGEITQ